MERCILIAASPEGAALARQALCGCAATLLTAHTMEEALASLRSRPVCAIVASMHFDDSLMPVLLDKVKTDAALRHIPFLCCRFRTTALSVTAIAALRHACAELTRFEMVDLPEWIDQLGHEAAHARFRERVSHALELFATRTPVR